MVMKISVSLYLEQARSLMQRGEYTDGCSTPFKTYIHRWLNQSMLLCAAHDYGNLGLIPGVNPGIHNNWMTLLAHLSQPNPIYWLWGIIVAVATLPWSIWRRNLGIKFIPAIPFHAFLLLAGVVAYLMYISI